MNGLAHDLAVRIVRNATSLLRNTYERGGLWPRGMHNEACHYVGVVDRFDYDRRKGMIRYSLEVTGGTCLEGSIVTGHLITSP